MIGNLQPITSNMTARILVVDDESHIRAGLIKALSIIGYLVDEAASGVEALTLLENISYDLMVLDMVMPDMNGEEMLQRVKQKHSDLLIIILTGNATLDNAIAAIKSGAVDYLRKPTSIHDIVDAVAKALQKRTAQSQKKYLIDELGHMLEKGEDTLSHSSQLVNQKLNRFVIVPPLILDRAKGVVTFVNNLSLRVALSKGETAVLASLMNNSGHVLSCRQLVRLSWGYELDKSEAESVIRPYISRLRGKIESDPHTPTLILTIRRHGYQFAVTNDKKNSFS